MSWFENDEISLIRNSRIVSFLSFVFGTILFLLYLITVNPALVFVGFIYTSIIALMNLCFLISLLINYKIYKEKRRKINLSILLLLVNLPIALGYFYIASDILFKQIALD